MANTIRIKRRAAGGGAGAPSSLQNAELAFNEDTNILYYGTGTGGAGGSATAIIPIAGNGAFVDTTTTQTVGGAKTFSSTITGSITGNAGTATALATARNIALSGDATGTASFDGTANATIATTLATVNSNVGTYTKVTVNGKGLVTAASNATLNDIGTPTTSFSMGSQLLTNLADPVSNQDAATKAYVDSTAQGLDVKASCLAGTTANITLSGTQTIDGVAVVAGDRVLVKNQTTQSENGIYVVAAGAWSRSADANTWSELVSAFTFIEQGTTNGDTGWVCTVNAGGTLGTTAVTWSQFSGAGTYQAGTGLTLTGNTFALTTPVAVTNGGTGVTTSTGSGSNVLSTSPTLVTPNLGTPSAATLTNATGLPIATGVSGLGTGIATALAVNVGTAGAPVINGGVLGTPSSGTLTNCTSLPIVAGTTGTLTVARGGTGATTFTANGIVYGNTTSALQVTAAGTWDSTNSIGQILSVNSAGVPTWTNTIDGGTY